MISLILMEFHGFSCKNQDFHPKTNIVLDLTPGVHSGPAAGPARFWVSFRVYIYIAILVLFRLVGPGARNRGPRKE